MGDVKLALLMGAVLGRTVPVALMAGCSWRSSRARSCSCATAARAEDGDSFGPFRARLRRGALPGDAFSAVLSTI